MLSTKLRKGKTVLLWNMNFLFFIVIKVINVTVLYIKIKFFIDLLLLFNREENKKL